MSGPDLGDPRFEQIARELRESAPPAPDALRQRVDETARATPQRRRIGLNLRSGLALAGATVVAVAFAAAGLNVVSGGNDGGDDKTREAARRLDVPSPDQTLAPTGPLHAGSMQAPAEGARATALPPSGRLQDYDARMTLRVRDANGLDRATKRAMRDTRSLGGYVSKTDFATKDDGGTASLVLRVPVGKIQEAIARYTALGEIVSQSIAIDDLQPEATALARRIDQLRARIAELVAKQRREGLTTAERIQLENSRRDLLAATGRRTALVRDATYATVTLRLTTEKQKAQKEEPGAFGTFLHDAGTILGTELVWLLYALVVAGPFLLLALIALLAERTRRRRSAEALLAHH